VPDGEEGPLTLAGQVVIKTGPGDAALKAFENAVRRTASTTADAITRELKRQGTSAEETQVVLEKLGLSGQKAGEAIARGFGRTSQEIREATVSAQIMEAQLGVHMPRAVNRMLAQTGLIGPALQYAFGATIFLYAAENIGKVISKIQEAALEWGGYSKASQQAFAETIKASDECLTHFQGLTTEAKIQQGHFLMAQTQARLAQIEQAKANKEQTSGILVLQDTVAHYWNLVLPTMHEAEKSKKTLGQLDEEETKLNDLLIKQNEEMNRLQKEIKTGRGGGRDAEAERAAGLMARLRDATDATDATDRKYLKTLDEIAKLHGNYNQELMRSLALQIRNQDILKGVSEAAERSVRPILEGIKKREEEDRKLGEEEERLGKQIDKQQETSRKAAEEIAKEADRQIEDIGRIGKEQVRQALRGREAARQRIESEHQDTVKAINDANMQAQAIAALTGDYAAMAKAAKSAYDAMNAAAVNYGKQLKELHDQERKAQEDDTRAKLEGAAADIETIVGAIAGQKAAAEVRGAVMCAEGAYDLAKGIWPPNPMLILKGAAEVAAGVEMLEAAGKGGRARGAGAGGVGGAIQGGGGERGERTEYGGGYGAANEQMLGLSPGAAGAPGGRLVVHIVGEQEASAWIAGAINQADQSGFHMQVAAARASAPAQG
jgi:hypothetical protein